MKKLNKNQRAFFEDAIKHFKLRSNNIKYGDLKAFAITHGLILPTSFLKNHCKTGEHGWYDLLKSDVTIDNPEVLSGFHNEWHDKAIEASGDDSVPDNDEPVIVEKSVYAEDEPKSEVNIDYLFKIDHEWESPVYVITDVEGSVRHICNSPKLAHDKVHNILHSGHSMTKQQVMDSLAEYGSAVIKSTNSQLKVTIQIFDMNK